MNLQNFANQGQRLIGFPGFRFTSRRDLPTGYDYFNNQPDPYVIFFKNSGVGGRWKQIMETQAVIDSRKPNCNEILIDNHAKLNAGQVKPFFFSIPTDS